VVLTGVAVSRVKRRVRKKKEPVDFDAERFKGRFVPIVAKEEVEVGEGDSVVIDVEPVEVPPHHMLLLSPYARHPLGHVIAVGEEHPKMMELGRKVTYAYFSAVRAGTVEKGDVLGVLIIIDLTG